MVQVLHFLNVNNIFNMVLNKNIYLLNLVDHLALNNRFLNRWIGKAGPMALASEEPIFNPNGFFSFGAMLKTLCTVKTQEHEELLLDAFSFLTSVSSNLAGLEFD